MDRRIGPAWAGLFAGLALLALTDPLCAEPDPRQVWTASGGSARLRLRADYLPDFGLQVSENGITISGVSEIELGFDAGDRLVIEAPHGNFARFLGGSLSLDSGWTLSHRGASVHLDDLTLTPGTDNNGHPSLEARDAAGRHLLTLTHLHILAEHRRGLLTIHNADLVATNELAILLGLEVLSTQPLGGAWLDLDLVIPSGADVSGEGDECAERPLWPQAGNLVDVGLIDIGTVAYQGTDPATGKVKAAPSATLKNVSSGDIPWISKFTSNPDYPFNPADQHPFLAWNLYRIVDGRIEQLAASAVKHAFMTLNFNCDINCGDPHILWPGCEDVYSANTNDNNLSLGPRSEIEVSLGLWDNCGSFFDPGCTGGRTHQSETYENRLLVDPAELQTPGAEYFLDAWYLVQYDTNIFNSMGHVELTPQPAGGGWDFNPGSYQVGRAIDELIAPGELPAGGEHVQIVVPSTTPSEPYPDNMPQGHLSLLVQTGEVEPGVFRYNYALQNFDFERGVEAFHIPIPAGSSVTDHAFRDLDDDPGNDWTVSIHANSIEFQAPPDNPLRWFSLYNFEIEVDAPAVAGAITLELGDGAVAPSLGVPILGPAAVPTDSDGDGMDDDWEVANDLDPEDPTDAGMDPDDDGLTNLEEYHAGTDPRDSDSDDDGILDGYDAQPNVDSNACSGLDAIFENTNVASGQIVQCAAAGSIVVEPTVVVEPGGRVDVFAPVTRFRAGFSVPAAGEMRVLATPPI